MRQYGSSINHRSNNYVFLRRNISTPCASHIHASQSTNQKPMLALHLAVNAVTNFVAGKVYDGVKLSGGYSRLQGYAVIVRLLFRTIISFREREVTIYTECQGVRIQIQCPLGRLAACNTSKQKLLEDSARHFFSFPLFLS
jgi:hypothetical protein